MDLYDEDGVIDEKAWYFVRQIQGVIGFIGGGDRPQPLAPSEVEDLMRQTAAPEEKVKPKIQYEIGETVRIKDGAFENFEGVIEGIDPERGKLKLMVSIFGRSTPVELEFWQVGREQ
jgi:transcriptional antiterminator NusG